MTKIEHTPGPWEYVPSTEHHGPYVTSAFGSTICDCYLMSLPSELSVRNGGKSKPVPFLHEMADPNARLIAAAPDMLADHKENARILGFLVNELQGRIEAGKLGAVMACLDRCNASVAKAEDGS